MRKKDALKRIAELEAELAGAGKKLNMLSVQYEKMLNDYKVCYSALEASQKRIKELSEENTALSQSAEELRANNAKLCEQNEDYRSAARVENVCSAPVEPESEATAEPMENEVVETKPIAKKANVQISEIEKYGSGVIGKVVVEATKIIGELSGKTSPNAKDVLTLALGRTEVLKSEVLAIVRDEEMDDEQKKERINQSREQAMEYLASLAAQE